jgi:hypothetical protein
MSDDEPELRDSAKVMMAVQTARNKAYGEGAYELDEWEGFTCNDCGWRGLGAPVHDDLFDDDIDEDGFTQCPECAHSPLDTGGDIKWSQVVWKLINSDFTVEE